MPICLTRFAIASADTVAPGIATPEVNASGTATAESAAPGIALPQPLAAEASPAEVVAAEITPVRGTELEALAVLAREIWYEHYVPLIGRAQVDYMVSKFQSAAAMHAQIRDGYEYFILRRNRDAVGYFAVRARHAESSVFLSKFYLRREARGSGTGRACMEFIEQLTRRRGFGRIGLTVNKRNPAVNVYERMGFRIVADLVTDIGAGFVMDDFRMEKELA